MRLTLRTMLAYLDEILEPDDQAEIGRKIEESEFASDLSRRTRDVIGKLRLGAPPLSGRGVTIDANTVAEYLDNSLASERVADFERACLESDVGLAEVAACHQVLTLVLGQPAEVDAVTRERIYALAATTDQQEQGVGGADAVEQEPAATGAAPASTATPPTDGRRRARRRRKREIPEYLREPSGSPAWRFVAAAAAVVLLIGAGVVIYVGPQEVLDYLRGGPDRVAQKVEGSDGGAAEATAGTAAPGTPTGDGQVPPGQPPVGTQVVQPSNDVGQGTAAAPEAPTPTDPQLAGEGSQADQEVGREVEPGSDSPRPGQETAVAPAAGVPAGPGGQGETGPDGPDSVPPGQSDTGQPPPAQETTPAMPPDGVATTTDGSGDEGPLAPPVIPEDGTAAPDAVTTAGTGEETDRTGADEGASAGAAGDTPDEADPGVVAHSELGIYSSVEALLAFDATSAQWQRLPLRAQISADERLLALPSFRPQVTLTSGSGVTLDMVGPASLILQMADPEEGPGVELLYGRIILLNVGQAGNHLAFRIGEQRYLVEFGDLGATLAIEVTRHHLPGADPEEAPAPAVADIYATSGHLRWQIAGEDAMTDMAAPGQWRIVAGQLEPVAGAGPTPDWINAGGPSGLELRASRALDEELSSEADRPVSLVLQELVEGQRSGRRSEVRSLAARCAVHVGKFEPFVEALNDPEQKTWRPRLIESLEEALALGPDVAAAIRQAFIREHGDEAGAELYRLLRGFSGADLERGADKQLVDYLLHDQLDFRLLALWNLIRATGLGQTNRLQDPKSSRFQLARRWEQRLEAGEIVPKATTP